MLYNVYIEWRYLTVSKKALLSHFFWDGILWYTPLHTRIFILSFHVLLSTSTKVECLNQCSHELVGVGGGHYIAVLISSQIGIPDCTRLKVY